MIFRRLFTAALIFSLFTLPLFSEEEDVHFNPWELIIYRPENNGDMNLVRCWLTFENENGEDATECIRNAWYEFPERNNYKKFRAPGDLHGVTKENLPHDVFLYKHSYYLSGGMAMHLNIKPGKYRISFNTPADKTNMFICENEGQWESNVLQYDTNHPVKVIFVCPTSNDNGFYNGGWWVDFKAPKYFKFTIPKMEKTVN